MSAQIDKTTITLTVLHLRGELPDELENILYETDQGHAVGLVTAQTTTPVAAAQVPDELRKLGNDGSFFDDDLNAED